MLGIYSGTPGTPSVTSTQGAMYIVFKSDYAFKYPGWSANYTAVCNPYCTGTTSLTSDAGIFDDGSDTSDYYNNSNCSWLIQPLGATSITLYFLSFNTELNYDFVNVYDGTNSSATLIGSYSGATLPNSVASTGGNMFVEFISDYIVTASGWEAYYIATFPSYCSGTNTLTATSGSFSDGSGANVYGNDADCKWLIQPPGATSITLLFSAFDTELNYDGVIVYDGVDTSATQLGLFTGSTIPSSVTSTGGSLLVWFLSDESVRLNGWDANYTSTVSTPSASISASNDVMCNGDCNGDATVSVTGGTAPFTYLWSDGQNTSTATGLCDGNYTVTITDTYGYTDTTSVTITEPPAVPANAGADVNICIGSSTNLSASGGVSYSWSPTTGLSNPNIANPVANPTSTSTYTVTVTDGNGCTNTDDVIVTVNALPTANAGTDVSICSGSNTTLLASGGVSYSWNPTTGLSNPNIANPIASPTSTITYTVTVTEGNGCTDTDDVIVTVNTLPTANAGTDISTCSGSDTTLSASGGVSYSWSPTTGLSNPNIANPVASPTSTITYTVTVTDGNGCTDTDAITVTITSSVLVQPLPSVTVTV